MIGKVFDLVILIGGFFLLEWVSPENIIPLVTWGAVGIYVIKSDGRWLHAEKHSGFTAVVSPFWRQEKPKGTMGPWELAKKIKAGLHSMNEATRERVRLAAPERAKVTGEVSLGYGRIKEITTYLGGIDTGSRVADLCCGAGGYTQWAVECGAKVFAFTQPHSLKKGVVKGVEEYLLPESADVEFKKSLLENEKPRGGFDWILFDAGEHYMDVNKESSESIRMLKRVLEWIKANPTASFVIRVQAPYNKGVIEILKTIQGITGRGSLERYRRDRYSQMTCQFVSGGISNLDEQAMFIMEALREKIEDGKTAALGVERTEITSEWQEQDPSNEAPDLPPMDMSRSLKDLGPMRAPLNITGYLKELGYWVSQARGTDGAQKNTLVHNLLAQGSGLWKELVDRTTFATWNVTSTTPRSVTNIVKEKIDKAPRERHRHWRRIRACYKGIIKYLRRKQFRPIKKISEEEMLLNINRQGGMGRLNKGKNLGEYVDRFDWRQDVQRFAASLRAGVPEAGIMNSTPKREKKRDLTRAQAKGSRLIWFYDGHVRLHEAMVFGDIGRITKALPWTVSGFPLYDLGDLMNQRMGDKSATAHDIAGWDTKISKGLQRMECEFLQELASTQRHKEEIREMYRLYANTHVQMQRADYCDTHEVIYEMRGQVASGRYPTYDMNTVTNIAVTLACLSWVEKVQENAVTKWACAQLESDEISGVFSGDDMVLFLERDRAGVFAQECGAWLEEIGMPRKGLGVSQATPVYTQLKDVEFCSHRYFPEKFHRSDGESHIKWMPTRDEGQIIGKAYRTVGRVDGEMSGQAWARIQGLNLMVMYHAVPNVRALAAALLTATPEGLDLSTSITGWELREKPWLTREFSLDMINDCLFGESSRFPVDFRLDGLWGLGYLTGDMRTSLTMGRRNRRAIAWLKGLEEVAIANRIMPGAKHTNWLREIRKSTEEIM